MITKLIILSIKYKVIRKISSINNNIIKPRKKKQVLINII